MNITKFKLLLRAIKRHLFIFSKEIIQDPVEEKILTNLKNDLNKKEYSFNNLEPFTKNLSKEDKLTFLELLNKDIFYNKKNLEILNKFHADSKLIFNSLKPLLDLNIKFSLDITGGAARDFVLKKDIKDLDIMLSIPGYSNLFYKFSFENLSKIFQKDEILNSNLFIKNTTHVEQNSRNKNYITPEYVFSDYSEKTIEALKKLVVSLCFKKHMIESESFFDKTNVQDKDYPVDKNRINCVFKVKNKTNYPIDILLTSLEKPSFLESFDFNICKASFCLFTNTCTNNLSPSLNYNKNFIEKPEFFISRFSATNSFCTDVRNKTISYNFYGKNLGLLKNSFIKHLPRIKNKYSDFTVETIGINPLLSNAIKIINEEKEFREEITPNYKKPNKASNKI